MGVSGTRPGFEDAEAALRPVHLGRYPMERIKRVDEPTTLIVRDEIRRMPKRADLFTRALAGDLGAKPKHERTRFAVKHPLAWGMTPLIRNMVPLQGTREPLAPTGFGGDLSDSGDPQRNADAIKALAYFLGADLVGICEAEPWMYYSHDEVEGKPIPAYHRYAVVMLVDQGFETMEGASGDDWISGAQSMRAYMRGAMIAGLIAAHVRRMGWSARAHSNAHSEVLHLPAVLMAGLGELSRIGELILNPFIGPRSKSVLFTTDLPLAIDKPIDFGLQAVCNLCFKCARECPCNAIPFGPKVMFNGYEIWKPDVEKCGKYRLTNMKGSACGRCMKTCPYNREDLVESDRLLWLSIEVPAARRQLVDYDDRIGGGVRNPVKRWWFDLEIVDGVCVVPKGGVNERDLDLDRRDKLAAGQKLAFFPPPLQPAGGTTMNTVVPVDRQAGLAAYAAAESPQAARRRIRSKPGEDT
jgi:ferredoxin